MFTLLVLVVSCVAFSGAYSITDDTSTGKEYPECNKPNEELNRCIKPCGGEDSCYDRNQYACAAVVSPCIPACVCKEGFIRKTLGRECIPKEECGGPCEIYTQYTDCKQSSKESCASITNPPKADEACKPGCTCWDGYHRENDTELCEHRCRCPGMRESPDCETWRRVYE
ncbi:hypothetical protein PYW07_015159 [Mythimna separata]|uniref:TIL domain-containing protein n=1 Tax=Mythimna separata TaxID=271217 RepID=A0AAD7YZQ9_MYTSE|nr:hypothetical protein PYW07_015159 [Mythimna separata]